MSGLDSARSGRRGDPEGRPLEGIHQAPMTEFFTRTFMQKYTDVPTFEALLEAGGHTLESWATTATFPDEDWERVIHKHTKFRSWQEMQDKAAADYFNRTGT